MSQYPVYPIARAASSTSQRQVLHTPPADMETESLNSFPSPSPNHIEHPEYEPEPEPEPEPEQHAPARYYELLRIERIYEQRLSAITHDQVGSIGHLELVKSYQKVYKELNEMEVRYGLHHRV